MLHIVETSSVTRLDDDSAQLLQSADKCTEQWRSEMAIKATVKRAAQN